MMIKLRGGRVSRKSRLGKTNGVLSTTNKNEWDGLVMSTEVVRGNSGSNDGRNYPVNAIKMNNTFDLV